MRWQLFAALGFTFAADRTRRITWSVSRGRLGVIVAAGVTYGAMGIGEGARGRRRGARTAGGAKRASIARASKPERAADAAGSAHT